MERAATRIAQNPHALRAALPGLSGRRVAASVLGLIPLPKLIMRGSILVARFEAGRSCLVGSVEPERPVLLVRGGPVDLVGQVADRHQEAGGDAGDLGLHPGAQCVDKFAEPLSGQAGGGLDLGQDQQPVRADVDGGDPANPRHAGSLVSAW